MNELEGHEYTTAIQIKFSLKLSLRGDSVCIIVSSPSPELRSEREKQVDLYG